MNFNFAAFYDQLETEVRASSDFAKSVAALMDWSARQIPHSDWSRLAEFDAAKELAAARRWLPRVLKRSPCPFQVRGVYFGLGEFADRSGVEYADLYFGLMSEYDRVDLELKWVWCKPRHYPDNSYLKSKALKNGGVLCNRESTPPGLSTPGHICFSVGFAALLLRHVLGKEVFQLLGGTAPIGVVTGFDSGDLLRLGEITADGFQPNHNTMV